MSLVGKDYPQINL